MPLFETKTATKKLPKTLREKFIMPPFSILDAKSGYWMTRKQEWEHILQDRKNNIRNLTSKNNTPYINAFDTDDFRGAKSPGAGNISTFDPFLCEILISWFSKEGMSILDPFAGSHVRGVISKFLKRDYWGIDISEDQVNHNWEEWKRINNEYQLVNTGDKNPVWELGDSEIVLSRMRAKHDMILICPPYYNLEQYTNNKDDLSNLPTYQDFIDKFTRIVEKCYNILRNDSFAVCVVEEIRDNNGIMYGFVPDTINAFKKAGFQYYNEMILENRIVSLGIRCPKYFNQSRKVGRHHQNILVFYKGDVANISDKFGNFIEE